MEIRIKDLTKIFPGDAKKNIRDIEDYNWPTLHADEGQLALPSLDDSLQHVDDGRSVSE